MNSDHEITRQSKAFSVRLERNDEKLSLTLTDWQVVAADTAAQPLWIAPQELTLLRCQA